MIKNKDTNVDINSLNVKDVIDINMLQKFQDNFAQSMGIASVTVDKNGTPVTKPSSYTNFCMNFIQSTKKGQDACAASHHRGGEEAARTGKPYVYTCQAGLIDFAAPIMIEGVHIGTILGGQILSSTPDEGEFTKRARELDVNTNGYTDALKQVEIRNRNNIEAAAEVLFIVANSLSKIGYEQLKLGSMSKNLSDNLNQISATMEELAASSVNVTSNQNALNKEISNVNEVSKEINSILDSIKSIADETKMLGLNAAIEAARAGEAGKGFGVVATEIRTLSQSSKETAVKISDLTKKIQDSVKKTIDTSKATLETTEQQSAAIEEANANVQEVSALTEELNNLANAEE